LAWTSHTALSLERHHTSRRPRHTATKRLNPTQRRLARELDQIAGRFYLTVDSITKEDPDSWTTRLQLAKDQLVRSQVVMSYTLVDDLLNGRIARYFFGHRRTFPQLWRTKRFAVFNYHVLEELSLLKKLRLVQAISVVPRPIAQDIERLNALRNALAHAFFPENLRAGKPQWKGTSILATEGIERFAEDMYAVFEHFMPV
jgi:hypothetical protein